MPVGRLAYPGVIDRHVATGDSPGPRAARSTGAAATTITALAVAFGLSACVAGVPIDPARPHHSPEGFRNPGPVPPRPDFWRWQRERHRDELPPPPANGYAFPRASPEVAFLKSNRAEPAVTWVGHATVLVQIGGVNVLTDPHLTERASPVPFAGPRRRVAPGLTFEQLPHIDAVVISHNHYDHLDRETVERLAAQPGGPPRFFVPLGLKAWFEDLGIMTAVELDWWESRPIGAVSIHLVPVKHWSQRTLFDRNATLWGGWVVEHPTFRFFFCGDSGYSDDFKAIGTRFSGFDLAALPIGAYAPRWFMSTYHIDPDEAVQVHRDLNAQQSLGIHWGTFEMTDEPLDEPPVRLAEALRKQGLPAERFRVLAHGQTWRLSPRQR